MKKMVRVKVIGDRAIDHEGKMYVAGNHLELHEDHAYDLVDRGFAELVEGPVLVDKQPSVVETMNDPDLGANRARYEAMDRQQLLAELERRGLKVSKNTPGRYLVLKLLQLDKGIA